METFDFRTKRLVCKQVNLLLKNKHPRQCIGWIQVGDEENIAREIRYGLNLSREGNGYMTEALIACTNKVIQRGCVPYLDIGESDLFEKSRAVAERARYMKISRTIYIPSGIATRIKTKKLFITPTNYDNKLEL